MNLQCENYCWTTFIIPFSVLYLFLNYSFLINIIFSFFIYCIFGGWKFIRVIILTGPRDVRALKCLIKVNFFVWNMKRKNITIPDIFEDTVKRKSSQIAFLFEDEKWTFTDINTYANKVANYLMTLGVKPGYIIGLFMESRPAYVAIWMGISKIGAVPALINFNLRKETLIHSINVVKAYGIICGHELQSVIEEINDDITGNINFKIVLNANKKTYLNGYSTNVDEYFDRLIMAQSSSDPPSIIRRSCRRLNDSLMYIFTSGTTGLPKAAKVSHARYLFMSYGANQMLGVCESDVIYNPLPLYHSAGGVIGVGQVLIQGVTMALRKKFSVSAFWEDCVKYNATVIQYIGEICRYLLTQPIKPVENQHKVRLAFGNGIRPQIWVEFQTRFKVAQIGEFYGATESNANIVNNVNKVGSVGFGTLICPALYPIVTIRIDENTGLPLRDKNGLCIKCKINEVGEMVGKINEKNALRQFDGYLSNDENQKKIIYDVFSHGDRGFLSGDLLVQDDLGFYYFRDRLGDTFRWKGENISSAEIEAIISNCLNLSDCVVYGVEIPNIEGRAGMAAIVHTGNDSIDLSVLEEKFRHNLPNYARPVFIRICQNIDMTGTFKLKKADLVKESFNPNITNDKLFFMDPKLQQYQKLDATIYKKIISGVIKY